MAYLDVGDESFTLGEEYGGDEEDEVGYDEDEEVDPMDMPQEESVDPVESASKSHYDVMFPSRLVQQKKKKKPNVKIKTKEEESVSEDHGEAMEDG